MKKKILSATFIIASFFAFSAKAQVPQELLDQTADYTTILSPNDSCTCTADTKNEQCKNDRKGRHGKGRHDKKGKRPDFFKGISLTTDQQQAIDSLRADFKANKERPERSDKKNLSKEEIEGMRAARAAERQLKFEEYKVAVQGILTPEQFAVFEKNVANFENEGAGCPSRSDIRKGDKRQARGDAKNRDSRNDRKKDGRHGDRNAQSTPVSASTSTRAQ